MTSETTPAIYRRLRLTREIDILSHCANQHGIPVAETVLQLIDHDLGFDNIVEPPVPEWSTYEWNGQDHNRAARRAFDLVKQGS